MAGKWRGKLTTKHIGPKYACTLAQMYFLVLVLIIATTTFQFLAQEGWLPSFVSYIPELVSMMVVLYVIAAGVRTQFRNVRTEYWLVFGALAFVLGCGLVLNAVEPGPMFAGVRTYLRAVPLFLLPAVWLLEDRRLRRQLSLLLVLALLQFPLALYQRLSTWGEHISGDWVTGTLMTSGLLSVFLICVACVLTGMYVRGRLGLMRFLPLLLLVLAPTTLNETKATIFLLPLGLMATFIAGSRRETRGRNLFIAVLSLSAFAAIFIPVYDYYITPRWGYGIVEFFTMEGRLEGYLAKDAEVGVAKAGKMDAIVVPISELARDPAQLVFGLGMGNASNSALGEQFTGAYFRRFEPFLLSSAATLILETGLLGLGLVMTLCLLIFKDALVVARREQGLVGALAAGWIGVVVVMVASLFYANVIANTALAFLFWYFSGVVAARRMRSALAAAPSAGTSPSLASLAHRSNAAT